MDYAYPADELMPLSCKGRVRGKDKSRGDIDDALGKFSLTLVDTLDSLVVMGFEEEFLHGVQRVIAEVKFDEDLVVSVFETNIRVLGGLLGAHAMMLDMNEQAVTGSSNASWTTSATLLRYRGELLDMALDIGTRLYKAFNTQTGLPYTRINLKRGLDRLSRMNDATCTACAGTLLLEFAALSRYFERAARGAMEALWSRRSKASNLVGETINVTSGQWKRTDASVGAGIDSLSSSEVYGLVANGDLEPAIETHKMYWQLFEKYGFFPEAYTLDLKIHWGNWPTYFLYTATGDPFYLEVGLKILDAIKTWAKVKCGFAAILDVRKKNHEDKMEDIAIDLDKYIFTTEAHLLPVAMPPPTYTLLPFGDANLDVRPAAPEHDSGCPRQKLTALEELANVIPGLWSRSSATCLRYSDKVRIPPPSYRKGRRGGSARGKLAAVEPYTGPAVPPEQLDVSNSDHVRFLRSINIQLRQQDGVVRLVYQKTDDEGQAEEVHLQVATGDGESVTTFEAGPAAFGPNLDNEYHIYEGRLVASTPLHGCVYTEEGKQFNSGDIVLVQRGTCMFVEKVRLAEESGARGVIVFDDRASSDSGQFTMSGDGTDNVAIPAAFVSETNGQALLRLVKQESSPIVVAMSGLVWEDDV
eukprot:gene514-15035_t